MFYSNPRREQSCDDLRYEKERLEEENERYRRKEEERRRDREAKWQERQEAWRESQCHANTWEEAFNKGLPRYRSEAESEKIENKRMQADPEWKDHPIYTSFQEWVPKLEAAQRIYKEKMKQTEERIKQIRQEALEAIAAEVDAELDFPELAQAFRDDDCEFLTNW